MNESAKLRRRKGVLALEDAVIDDEGNDDDNQMAS